MKINKLFTLGLLGMFALASCDNADEPVYAPAQPVENPEVCFKRGENTPVQLAEDQSSFSVAVYRRDAAKDATYTIETTDVASIYTDYPTEVTFAAGENVAKFNVGIDFSKVVDLERYNITFTLPNIPTTDYYLGSVTYTCYYEPWKTVTGPNGETIAKWRDLGVFALYSLDEAYAEWDVTIEESPTDPNIIRIPNPYSRCEYLEGAVDTSDELYFYFNITETEGVFFCDKNGNPQYLTDTGVTLNSTEGRIYVTSFANYYIENGRNTSADMYGKLRNGNLTWAVDNILFAFENEDGLYYGNRAGQFLLLWPGATETVDPTKTWTTIGEAQFTDAWMSPYIGDPAPTIPVTVQQNGANPDYYRLVAPFSYIIGETLEGTYLYLDCSNYNNVLIPLQESNTGLRDETTTFYATNYAEVLMNWMQNPASEAEVIAGGYNSTFDGTTITVPADNVIVVGVTNGQMGIEETNNTYDGVIVLPTPEETQTYKKSAKYQRQSVPSMSENRQKKIDALFNGKIVPIKNIGQLKSMK